MSAFADVPVTLAANFAFDRKMTNEETKAEWWRFNNSFTNTEIRRPSDLDEIVSRGHSICACHAHVSRPYTNSAGELRHTAYRHSDNWLPSSVLMLDFDSPCVRALSKTYYQWVPCQGRGRVARAAPIGACTRKVL